MMPPRAAREISRNMPPRRPDMNNGCYMDSSGVPLHFAGTEPRRRGYPPLEDEGDVGTPFAQWELELRGSSPDAWYHYRNTGEW